ncbi:MAG: hypothetical protein HPY54_06770 [Chthonomonadetes bacterium]|nr:hypothetical protein [Chthonomonadetes bacterium]
MSAEQPPTRIVYPESDGQPIADNAKQLEYTFLFYDNLCALFADREDVFVAADLLWYPVEGDALVLYRPDGERFVPYVELRRRAEQAEQRALQAEQRALQAEQRAQEAEERAQRLAQRLREMGIEPEEI